MVAGRAFHWMIRPLLATCLLLPAICAAADQASLREQVFGKREAREQLLDVTAEIDGTAIGEVAVSLRLDQLLSIDRDALLELLRSWFDDRGLACLAALPARLSPAQGETCELGLSFDPAALSMRIQLPLERRPERMLTLRASRSGAPALRRQGTSAYINLSLNGRQRSGQASDLATLFDGAVGRADSTLEFEGSCASDRCGIDLAALVHDQPERLRRWQLGDLGSPRAGMLGLPGMRGLSVGTDFDLQPTFGFTPQLQAPLELDRAGTLEVWQGGRLVRRERLGPGRYRLSDFPLGFGWNEAVVRVTDDAGKVETRSLQTYVDLSLLGEGLSRSSAALGYPRIPLQPDEQRPWILALEQVRGLRLGTVGVASVSAPQLDHHAIELAWTQGDERGLWGARLGCSHRADTGCRASFALRLDGGGGVYGWQQQAQLDWRDAHWQDVVDPVPAGAERAVSWRAYTRLSERWQLAVAAQGRQQPGQRRSSGAGVQLAARLAGGWSLRLGLEHRRERSSASSTRETGLSINLGWLFDRARQSVNLNYNGIDRVGSLGWQHARGGQRGGWATSVSHTDGPLATLQSASTRWRAERWSGEASFARTDADGQSSNEFGLQAQTALVYAEGVLGVAERVNGAFAILQPAADDVGPVYVNPYADDYLASDRGPGPAVVSNLRPYQPRELVVSMPKLPTGRDPGELLPRLMPPYKGGVLVALGGQASVGLRAVIVDSAAKPLEMVPGTLRKLDCDQGCPPDLPVFVGRNGRLTALGLTAGRWELVLKTTPPRRHDLELPVTATGLIDLGVLQP